MKARSPKFIRNFVWIPTILGIALGCRTGDGGEKSTPAPASSKEPEKAKDPISHIPVGKFTAGSSFGEPGRNPAFEPNASEIELGPFRIDSRLARSGDGAPRKGLSFADAEASCSAKGGRLCSDLEWQRACRGPSSDPYPGGKAPPKEGTGTSAFEIEEMGSRLEWTRSTFGPGSIAKGERVLVGAPSTIASDQKRCARRVPFQKELAEEVSFRCCYGAPNARTIDEPSLTTAHQERPLGESELRELLKGNPKTEALAEGANPFKPEAVETVFHRGPGESQGFTLTTNAIEWNPAAGLRYLLVSGRSGEKTSFVFAYALVGDKKVLAGSFLMKNEPGPVVLAYAPSIRPRVHFSTCFGCPGETGKVLFREPEEIVFLQP